jgi:hypothetical protein
MYIWRFTKSRENLPNVNLAVGGAPCFKMQASLFNFKKRINTSFFRASTVKNDLTLKVYATEHYIEDSQIKREKGSPNVKKVHPM